jgi:hypothetical protein
MADTFRIILPKNSPAADVNAARQELEALDGIEDTTKEQVYGFDPVSITVLVKLAAAVFTSASAAVPLIKQVVDLFRRRNLLDVELEIAGGGRLKIANATPADIDRIAKSIVSQSSTRGPDEQGAAPGR